MHDENKHKKSEVLEQIKRKKDEYVNSDDNIEAQRKRLWNQAQKHKEGLKKIKNINSQKAIENLVSRYSQQIAEKQETTQEIEAKIREMEVREAELVAKLQTTKNDQRRAYTSLENIVQVGQNYYQQCYDLKKKKRAELFPDTKAKAIKKEAVLLPADGKWGSVLHGHVNSQMKKKKVGRKNEKTEKSEEGATEPLMAPEL